MGRLSAWFSPLSVRAPSVPGSPPPVEFDEIDRYFLALRIGCAGAAAVWLWRFAAPAAAAMDALLVCAFVAYSLALYLAVWRRPEARAHAYLAVLPADLVFFFLACLGSAQPMSAIYLAFYLLVALHAFYFGAPIGLGAVGGFAVLYAVLYAVLPAAQRCSPEELLLRIGFAILVAVSLALISHQLRTSRQHLFEMNRQLQHRNHTLEQIYRHLSIGRLAGDVAHHINNPTAVIVGKAELMRQRAERDGLPPSYQQDIKTIADHAFRIARVVRSLVALAPRRAGAARSLDLAEVAEGVVVLFENQATERHVRLERDLVRGLRVHGEESALRQVIVHLLSNALDAIEPGRHVAVETRSGAEPQTVELRVRDSGHGICQEHLDDIFNPFFTTKDGDHDGVGLGLSQSLTIVHRLGGTLTADSTLGNGSTFTVTLPADTDADGREEAA